MSSIDPLGYSALFSQSQELAKKENKANKSTSKKVFSSLLEKASTDGMSENLSDVEFMQSIENKNFDEKLEFLIDSVYSAGDRLKKNPEPEEFKNYRKKMSFFLQFVVKNSYEIETQHRRKGRKRVVYTMVQVVNEKLDSLAADILMNQREQLRILAKLEEINGLLVDFFS